MIEIQNLCKIYYSDMGVIEALSHVNLTINDGDIFGIIGRSGSGKSTLARCINLLETPSEGRILLDGIDYSCLSKSSLHGLKNKIAMVFQSFNLLSQKNCLKNVCFPLEINGMTKKNAEVRARELLKLVGLEDKILNYPAQLSGGQQQRVAIARAFAMDPQILICDEATSALDPRTTFEILNLIGNLSKMLGVTVIIITHQMTVVESICNKVAILNDGRVAESGLVNDIFTNPQSREGKLLIQCSHDSLAFFH